MDVSFDPAKRAETLKRRGLDFADAGKVFAGRTVTTRDARRDYGEDRYITAGHLGGRCVVLAWTPRDEARRIISMRYAHADEEARWLGQLDRS
ncbi:MAG TPA: BrnT family toxin [Acetobacteraceae bacterium]